jgi:hypothetical protein
MMMMIPSFLRSSIIRPFSSSPPTSALNDATKERHTIRDISNYLDTPVSPILLTRQAGNGIPTDTHRVTALPLNWIAFFWVDL